MIDISDIQKDIQITKNRIRALQTETVHCIAIKPTGKIEVVDKAALEALNSEVDRLAALSQNNEAVLARLMDITGGVAVAVLVDRKNKLAGHIQRTRDLLRHDQADLLKRSPALTLETLGSDPRAQRLQADAQAILEKELPELERIAAQIAQANETIDDYRPSDVKERIPQHTSFVGGF